MEIVYAIATIVKERYECGSSGHNLQIHQSGLNWDTASFPPIFKTKKSAEEYLESIELTLTGYEMQVVRLELIA